MNKNEIIQTIQQFSFSVVEESIEPAKAEKYIKNIHTYFQQITEITGFENKIDYLAAIPAAQGKALGLNHAAQCLLDYNRTVLFVKGIVQAIRKKQQQFPNTTIQLFYAGCGPYATLLTLVAPLFTSAEVQFTLLEINKNSVDAAKKLITAMELTNHVSDFYLADAVTFKIPQPEKFHVLISETLDAVLYRECYVPILFNLLPQLNKDVVVIPENVLIDVFALSNSKDESSLLELNLGTIVNVKAASTKYMNNKERIKQLEEFKISFKTLDKEHQKTLLIDTKVHIHESIWLKRSQSSLTLPLKINLDYSLPHQSMVFTYFLEPEVELRCSYQ